MRIARATAKDVTEINEFLIAAESVLEKEKFSLNSPEDQWLDLDDDDPDKKTLLHLQKQLAEEMGVDIENVDNRILMYEFLVHKFRNASCGWRRVVWGYEPVVEAACDPTLSYLDFHPGLELNHVDREM